MSREHFKSWAIEHAQRPTFMGAIWKLVLWRNAVVTASLKQPTDNPQTQMQPGETTPEQAVFNQYERGNEHASEMDRGRRPSEREIREHAHEYELAEAEQLRQAWRAAEAHAAYMGDEQALLDATIAEAYRLYPLDQPPTSQSTASETTAQKEEINPWRVPEPNPWVATPNPTSPTQPQNNPWKI